jgi:chromosome segregation ATPase
MLLDLLVAGPRRGLRALDDLGVVASALRRLSAEDGDLHVLSESARQLPVVEDQLSASVAALRDDIELLRDTVTPLHREAADLDSTAESLEAALAGLRDQVGVLTGAVEGFREDLANLRDRIPGL